jgi:hypothetical protein
VSAAAVQTLVVVAIVLGATAYLARKVWLAVAGMRRAKNAPGCGSDCGCGKT